MTVCVRVPRSVLHELPPPPLTDFFARREFAKRGIIFDESDPRQPKAPYKSWWDQRTGDFVVEQG